MSESRPRRASLNADVNAAACTGTDLTTLRKMVLDSIRSALEVLVALRADVRVGVLPLTTKVPMSTCCAEVLPSSAKPLNHVT
eukprot:1984397-Pyramimonas_sp.AAC.1